MAEIGLIASVISVGTLAAQSSKALYDLVNTVINAPAEINAVSADVQGIHGVILSLHSQLLEQDIQQIIQADSDMLKMLTGLKDPLANCSKTSVLLTRKLQRHLKRSDDGKGFKVSNVDLKWWFTKGSLKELQDRLGQNKASLNMALSGITALISMRTHALLQASYNQHRSLELTVQTPTEANLQSSHSRRKSTDTDAGSALREYARHVTASKSRSMLSVLESPSSLSTTALNETQAEDAIPRSTLTPESNLQRLRRMENQRTGLHRAATDGDDLAVEIILDEGAFVNAKDVDGKTALHVAASLGNEAVVRTLLKYGADVDAKTILRGSWFERKHCCGRTPLHWAAANGHDAIVRLLSDHLADVGAVNATLRTPLQDAIMYKHTAVAKTLIELGASLHSRDAEGWTPLHQAAKEGNHEMTKVLLDRGADLEPLTASTDTGMEWHPGRTPLHIVAETGSPLVLQELLTRGINIEARTEDGYTALHIAALCGHQVLVRKLLEAGMDPEAKNTKCEDTALHKAALKGHVAVIRVLLQNGADVLSTNILGRTPAEHARAHGYEEAAQRIDEHSANTHN